MVKRDWKVERYAAALSWQVFAENLKSLVRMWQEVSKTAAHVIRNLIYEVWNFNSGNYLFTTDTK